MRRKLKSPGIGGAIVSFQFGVFWASVNKAHSQANKTGSAMIAISVPVFGDMLPRPMR
jgi:hypothetical protein